MCAFSNFTFIKKKIENLNHAIAIELLVCETSWGVITAIQHCVVQTESLAENSDEEVESD